MRTMPNTNTRRKSQSYHITHKDSNAKLTTNHLIASEHTRTVHTVVTTEWPYTPRQTALYYHMMFIRTALPQRILASLSLPQPGGRTMV